MCKNILRGAGHRDDGDLEAQLDPLHAQRLDEGRLACPAARPRGRAVKRRSRRNGAQSPAPPPQAGGGGAQ